MTQEDKELLLKDLCARLPYRVIIQTKASGGNPTEGVLWSIDNIETGTFIFNEGSSLGYAIEEDIIKPYLRPMSSMTEEERKIYIEISSHLCGEIAAKTMIDWLNKNHFDYRGLIPKDLAIEVTEENNPYK